MNWKSFWEGVASILDWGGVFSEPRPPKTHEKIMQEIEDGYRQDAQNLKEDWEKIIGRW